MAPDPLRSKGSGALLAFLLVVLVLALTAAVCVLIAIELGDLAAAVG